MENSINYKKRNFYLDTDRADAAYAYAAEYVKYLDASKTEREAVNETIKMAEANGYKPYTFGMPLNAGDKLYYNNRNKAIFLFRIGEEDISNGIRISAAHIDSPRIDLKQCPLYENSGMAFFKTHYYGGIRKYQWLATPLALHGVIVKPDGEVINVCIGEDDEDPIFYINDLLPHLAADYNSKPLGSAIAGEKLNALIGSVKDEKSIKHNVLRLLNEKYGIVEEDFLSAELSLVPAAKARDVGLDRSLIGAYGHDDRVCAYPALTSIFECANSEHTLMCILADKEEVGSDGNSGMQCDLMLDLINEIAASMGANPALVRANSKCLSADVSACYDPNFPEVFEKNNSSLLNCGVVLTKYTGSRGKGGTNDASAEFIGWLRGIMAKDGVVWQSAELGKIDVGGGGTVAKFVSKHNIEVVDLGVPVLSMHAPCEVISKVDLYEAHRAFCAFCKY